VDIGNLKGSAKIASSGNASGQRRITNMSALTIAAVAIAPRM
jgi:hypothetical protein